MSDQEDEFERIAISRDLVRKPEVKLLAQILHGIVNTEAVVTDEIPAFYIILAHRIATKKEKRDVLLSAIQLICGK